MVSASSLEAWGALGPPMGVGGRAETEEEALRRDHLSGQGGAHGALALKGESRQHAHAPGRQRWPPGWWQWPRPTRMKRAGEPMMT
jgi:hypothetical protein